jgi:hypothetical protein
MRNFVQATEYEMYMYGKFEYLEISIVIIFKTAIMCKNEFGQV